MSRLTVLISCAFPATSFTVREALAPCTWIRSCAANYNRCSMVAAREGGQRSGTVSPFLAVGFGTAARLAQRRLAQDQANHVQLAATFVETLKEQGIRHDLIWSFRTTSARTREPTLSGIGRRGPDRNACTVHFGVDGRRLLGRRTARVPRAARSGLGRARCRRGRSIHLWSLILSGRRPPGRRPRCRRRASRTGAQRLIGPRRSKDLVGMSVFLRRCVEPQTRMRPTWRTFR